MEWHCHHSTVGDYQIPKKNLLQNWFSVVESSGIMWIRTFVKYMLFVYLESILEGLFMWHTYFWPTNLDILLSGIKPGLRQFVPLCSSCGKVWSPWMTHTSTQSTRSFQCLLFLSFCQSNAKREWAKKSWKFALKLNAMFVLFSFRRKFASNKSERWKKTNWIKLKCVQNQLAAI